MQSESGSILECIRHMLSATANAALYGVEHPQVQRLSALVFTTLSEALQSRSELTLMVVENELVIDDQAQEMSLF